MNIRLSDFVRWKGTIDRGSYLLVGALLTLVKVFIDRTVALQIFHRSWTLFHYVIPGEAFGIMSLPRADQYFYLTMVLLALPFIWIGVLLTLKRLRDIPLPSWLVLLFFAPLPINMIFFLLLCVLPRAKTIKAPSVDDDHLFLLDTEDVGVKPAAPPGLLDRLLPENNFANALVSVLLPVPFAIALGVVSVKYFQNYGWGIFIGLPFALPTISVLLYAHRRERTLGECMALGMLWTVVMVGALFALAFEGAICLILALPLIVPIVFMGAFVGYLIQALPLRPREANRLMLVLLAVLPALIGAEGIAPREAPLFEVKSSVVVAAPPERVWRHVVAFSELPPPDDWVFRTGIAYPLRAEIDGRGPGAIRHCVFSTGAFVEPIEVWDEPRLLQFAVTSNPPPMKEWSPIANIHPPHLDRYLVSRRGQFLLTPLPGGRTRLEGTTWYQHNMWPAAYWRIWSDQIIRRIHLQVLRHVKRLAEAPRQSG